MTKLQVNDVTKNFGGVVALKNCSLNLEPNKVYGLIGPNGSGKTTLFNVISGLTRPDSGKIIYDGRPIQHLSPHEIVRKGITRTFQLTRVFAGMTVMENLRAVAPREKVESEDCQKLLKMTALEEFKDEKAGNLSYGQKKQLELARIMMMDSDILMLDEPTAGLSANMIDRILEQIRYARERGKTVFIIEHNLSVIMNVCEWIFVLENGRKIAEGLPAEIRHDELVVKAYIGEA